MRGANKRYFRYALGTQEEKHYSWGTQGLHGLFPLCVGHQRDITGDISLDSQPLKVVEELISINELISFAVPPP